MGEAVLELQGEGAAHRVQTVGGVDSGAQLRLLDRELRQQVELDRVAERLVDADAVLEDGDPLRQPEERGEAVKPRKRSVGWKRLVVVPSSGDRPEAFVQGVGEGGRPPLGDLGAADAGHDARRHAVAVDPGSGQRGHSHHVDPFHERRECERHVELTGLPRRDANVTPLLRLEAFPREGDRPGAGREHELARERGRGVLEARCRPRADGGQVVDDCQAALVETASQVFTGGVAAAAILGLCTAGGKDRLPPEGVVRALSGGP